MSDPNPEGLVRFLDLLTEQAPDDYEPWLFRVEAGAKGPDLSYGSWKDEDARLSPAEAVEWMKQGGNVGIAGRGGCEGCGGRASPYCPKCEGEGCDDRLVNVDIDDEDETTADDLKDTLIARSRSRTGMHAWYFEADGEDIPNIPTDNAGEVRANWQYVVAPGSYVETDESEVPADERDLAGYYTVEDERPVGHLAFDELPDVFQRVYQDEDAAQVTLSETPGKTERTTSPAAGETKTDGRETRETGPNETSVETARESESALFDITAEDVAARESGRTGASDRWSAIFHGSETGKNMSLSDAGLLQCWRHEVAHNGLQALAVLSDYRGDCADVGTGHKHSGAGRSCLRGENGAHIWHAWKYAKQNGYIPDDDPLPYSAIVYLCKARDLCAVSELPSDGAETDETVPAHAYDAALSSVRNHDDLDPGRVKTDEIEDAAEDSETPSGEKTQDKQPPTLDDDSPPTWEDVIAAYDLAEQTKDTPKGIARELARQRLEADYDWMFVRESERLWVYNEDSGTYDQYGKKYIDGILREELAGHYARSERGEVVAGICAANQVSREKLNARHLDDPLLCVGNGVANLETGELLDHAPRYRFVRGLSWSYATEKNELSSDTDRILSFLDDVTERVEDRDTLLDHLAHGLMPGHPYRAFVVTFGSGANGKTQVAKLFREFVGEDGAASVEIDELVNDDFATGDLPGKFINWGDDMSGDGGGTLEEISKLKKASGGSSIRANEKYEKTFDFKNEAALFFSANEPPRIGEGKMSVKDRLYPIRMPYRFMSDPDPDDPMQKEKTPNIAAELTNDDAAMRGLLELAVDHAQALSDRKGEYSMPEGPEERWELYNKQADPLSRFARTALEPAAADMKVRKDDAYRVYLNCMEGWSERGAGEDGFKRQLPRTTEADVETARSRALATDDDEDRVYCWKRLAWRDDAKEYMPDWLIERYADHFDSETTATDEDTSADDPAPSHVTPSDVSVSDDALDREKAPPVRGRVAAIWENRYGQPVAELESDDGAGTIDIQIVGFDSPDTTPISAGTKYELDGLRYRKPDDAVPYFEFRPTVSLEVLDRPETSGEGDDDDGSDPETTETPDAPDTDSDATAAADGGKVAGDDGESWGNLPADDETGPGPNAQRVRQVMHDAGATSREAALTAPEIADRTQSQFDVTDEQVGYALRKGHKEMGIFDFGEEVGYWLLE